LGHSVQNSNVHPVDQNRDLEEISKNYWTKNWDLEEMSKNYWTKCKACGKKVQTGPSFVQHLTRCEGIKRRTCQECNKLFGTKELMLAHARVMHLKLVEQFLSSSCPDCKLPFPSMAEVDDHVCQMQLTQTKKDLNLDNIDVTLEWLLSKHD
jgi:hypothetical protein